MPVWWSYCCSSVAAFSMSRSQQPSQSTRPSAPPWPHLDNEMATPTPSEGAVMQGRIQKYEHNDPCTQVGEDVQDRTCYLHQPFWLDVCNDFPDTTFKKRFTQNAAQMLALACSCCSRATAASSTSRANSPRYPRSRLRHWLAFNDTAKVKDIVFRTGRSATSEDDRNAYFLLSRRQLLKPTLTANAPIFLGTGGRWANFGSSQSNRYRLGSSPPGGTQCLAKKFCAATSLS